jgi:GT2 family glycosyltransferase
MTPTYDIVIPHYGVKPELNAKLRLCLYSIAQYSDDYRVILVDNGSHNFEAQEDSVQFVIDGTLARMPHVLIRNSKNLGFVRAINQGLQYSTAPYVVMLNNDTFVAHGWLEALRQPFLEDPTVGLVGPLTDDAGWQGRYHRDHPDAKEWVMLPPGRMLAFFCAMISRKCLETVGYQDEAFVPYGGFGGDDHYCALAEAKGFRLALQRDVLVHHDRRSTFHTLMTVDESKALQVEALAKFKELKHGI